MPVPRYIVCHGMVVIGSFDRIGEATDFAEDYARELRSASKHDAATYVAVVMGPDCMYSEGL